MTYNDQTIMPFGTHQGKTLEQVPASYLLHLFDKGLRDGPLRRCILDNMDVLRKQNTEQLREAMLQRRQNRK